jgi:hypothetical protein
MVTMTQVTRSPRSSPTVVSGALLGLALAAAAALTGLLRRDKPLHPVGHLGTGHLTITDPVPDLGAEALAHADTRPCRLRWSRAMGLPQGWPDIEGIALRLAGARSDGGDADLLFASTGDKAWNRYLLTMRAPRHFGRLTTLLPVRAGGRAVTFRLSPLADPTDALPPTSYALDVARGTGAWEPVGHVDVVWSETDTAERFDPITRPLAGLEQYAFVEGLREPAYGAARAVARARPTTRGRHHA